LWLMNAALNIIMGPGRAVIADLVPKEYQQAGNAMISTVMGFANIIANLIGAQDIKDFLGLGTQYRVLFMIGAVFQAFSTIPVLIFAKETPLSELEDAPREGQKVSIISVFKDIYNAFRYMPGYLFRIWIVFFFSWMAYSPFNLFLTKYFIVVIYGATDPADFAGKEAGLRLGMYGLAILAGVTFTYSIVLPKVLKLIGIKLAYAISQFIAAFAFLLFGVIPRPPLWVAFLITGLPGINFTTFNSVPYGLLGKLSPKSTIGLYMGVMNVGSSVAQTIINQIAGPIADTSAGVGWAIGIGFVLAIIAGLLVFVIQLESKESETIKPLIDEVDSEIN